MTQTTLFSPNFIPSYNRGWLAQLRSLYGLTHKQIAEECGISNLTYAGLENAFKGSYRKASIKTMRKVADAYGIKTDIFYFHTNEQGQLTEKSSITDIILLFNQHGFKYVVNNEAFLRAIFTEELVKYILETYAE